MRKRIVALALSLVISISSVGTQTAFAAEFNTPATTESYAPATTETEIISEDAKTQAECSETQVTDSELQVTDSELQTKERDLYLTEDKTKLPLSEAADYSLLEEAKEEDSSEEEAQLWGSVDLTAPVLSSLSFSSKTVYAGQSVEVIADITDDKSGVKSLVVDVVSDNKYYYFTLEKSEGNKWKYKFDTSKYMPSGTYRVSFVYFSDNEGNAAYYSSDECKEMFSNVYFELVNNGTADTKGPVIEDAYISTNRVDCPGSVEMKFTVSDDLSGTDYFFISFRDEDYNYIDSADFTSEDGKVWTANLSYGIYGPSKYYIADYIVMRDKAGNYSYPGISDVYDSFGVYLAFQVVANASDTQAPQVKAISTNPSIWDAPATGESDISYEIVIDAEDDKSGVSFIELAIISPISGKIRYMELEPCEDGKWRGHFDLSSYVEPGEYRIYSFEISDAAGNKAEYSQNNLPKILEDFSYVVVNPDDEKETATAPIPSIEPGAEVEEGSQLVLSATTVDSVIYYTTDGSRPGLTSPRFGDSIVLDKNLVNPETGEIVVKAFTQTPGINDSAIVSFVYTIMDENTNWGELTEEDRLLYSNAAEIPTGIWTTGLVDEVAYTGYNITPGIRVYYGKKLLIEGKDYTIKYQNNKNAASKYSNKAPTLVITGKGSYTFKLDKKFTITAKSISGARVTMPLLSEKTSLQKASPVVEIFDTNKNAYIKLVKGTDYNLNYPDTITGAYKVAGQWTVEIIGKGNYTDSIPSSERIVAMPLISTASVTLAAGKYDNGNPVVPTPIVKVKGKQVEGRYCESMEEAQAECVALNTANESAVAFVYYCENNTQAGNATMHFIGVEAGGLAGTLDKTYKITGTALSSLKILGIETGLIYTGKAQEQTNLVLYNASKKENVTAVKAEEYDAITNPAEKKSVGCLISYLNNVNAGTATVIFTGVNEYTGTVKKTFVIKPYDLSKNEGKRISADTNPVNVDYEKGGVKPEMSITYTFGDDSRTLVKGTDYTLSWLNNKAVNQWTTYNLPAIVVQGKGNFTGKWTAKYFKIGTADIGRTHAVAKDVVYKNAVKQYSATVLTITDLNEQKLVSGTDFDKKYEYSYAKGAEVKHKDGSTVQKNPGDRILDDEILPVGTVIKVKVSGAGNYTGSVETTYRVVAGDISKATVTVGSYYFTGKAIKPQKSEILVKTNGTVLEPTDYEIVGFANNYDVGKASFTIRGTGSYGGEKIVTFNIVKSPAAYTVQFYGNTATGGSTATQNVKTYSALLSKNKFVKKGYEFVGWNTRADGKGTAYSDQQQIDAGAYGEVLKLYAQWKKATYTITYNNVKSAELVGTFKSKYTVDDEFVLQEDSNYYATFAGWFTDKGCTKKITEIKKGTTGNLNLYAKWIPIKYTIRFDSNGGKGSMASIKANLGEIKQLPAATFTNSGGNYWRFIGWNTKADGSGYFFKNKGNFYNYDDSREVTLYAQWGTTVEFFLADNWKLPHTISYYDYVNFVFQDYRWEWYENRRGTPKTVSGTHLYLGGYLTHGTMNTNSVSFKYTISDEAGNKVASGTAMGTCYYEYNYFEIDISIPNIKKQGNYYISISEYQ